MLNRFLTSGRGHTRDIDYYDIHISLRYLYNINARYLHKIHIYILQGVTKLRTTQISHSGISYVRNKTIKFKCIYK